MNVNITVYSVLSALANWMMVPFQVVSYLQFQNYFYLHFLNMFLGASSNLFGMCLRDNKLIKSHAKLILSLSLKSPLVFM